MLGKIIMDASNGDAEAMFRLGIAFAFGTDGMRTDADEAVHWLTKAASRGHAIAAEVLKDIGRTQETIKANVECEGEKKIKRVQLWEDGPYWADRNIGAENPWDSGYYFWWGDTVGYEWKNGRWVASDGLNTYYSFADGNTSTYGKGYSALKSDGWISADVALAPQHDAAQKHWSGDWRMPTADEFDDLRHKCDWIWTTTNDVMGNVVRGRGDYVSKSIFLPCAGYGYGTSLNNAGSYGYYWSSVPNSDYDFAWSLNFSSSYHSTINYGRNYGQSVRPLQGFAE